MPIFKAAKKELLETIKKELLRPSYLKELGKMAADIIKVRTRLGFGARESGANREKLKPLSETYIEQRKGLAAYFTLNGKTVKYKPDENGQKMKINREKTSPTKSNLTKTGQMLDSMDVIKVSSNVITVGPTGVRSDDGIPNEVVAELVSEGGRPFNNLTKVELKRLRDKIARDLEQKLSKVLTKIK